MHDVTIHAVLNGYLVTVGCQQVVYNSRGEMIADLVSYLDEPGEITHRMLGESLNSKILSENTVPQRVNVSAVSPAGSYAEVPEARQPESGQGWEEVEAPAPLHV